MAKIEKTVTKRICDVCESKEATGNIGYTIYQHINNYTSEAKRYMLFADEKYRNFYYEVSAAMDLCPRCADYLNREYVENPDALETCNRHFNQQSDRWLEIKRNIKNYSMSNSENF